MTWKVTQQSSVGPAHSSFGHTGEHCRESCEVWLPQSHTPAQALSWQPGVSVHSTAEPLMQTPGLADQHWQGELRNTAATQPELGPDVDELAVSALIHRTDILRLTISDKAGQRWQVTQLAQQLWPSGDFSECSNFLLIRQGNGGTLPKQPMICHDGYDWAAFTAAVALK